MKTFEKQNIFYTLKVLYLIRKWSNFLKRLSSPYKSSFDNINEYFECLDSKTIIFIA